MKRRLKTRCHCTFRIHFYTVATKLLSNRVKYCHFISFKLNNPETRHLISDRQKIIALQGAYFLGEQEQHLNSALLIHYLDTLITRRYSRKPFRPYSRPSTNKDARQNSRI